MNKEILIVDDEKDIRSSISDLLNDEDYNCRSVANSDDALFEIAKKVPDLVLLDKFHAPFEVFCWRGFVHCHFA